MNPERTGKLTQIFRTLFNQDDLVLRDDLTAEDVPGWDSLNHVNLIIQVEQEFGIRFSNEEVTSLQNVGQLQELIEAKLG